MMNSCKKEDKLNTRLQNEELQKAKDRVRKEIGQNGIPIKVLLDQKIEAIYADNDGQPISKEKLLSLKTNQGNKTSSIVSPCDYSNEPTAILNYYTIIYDCLQGYSVSWNYTVSTNNNLVASHPPVTSKGSIKIYDGATQKYSNTNVPVTITDLGADPGSAGYELFSVTYTTAFLAETYFNYTYTTKLGGIVVTDCDDVDNINIALLPYSATGYQFPNTNPCSRIDPFQINNITAPLRIWGEDPIGLCTGSGFVFPHLQEINFSIDGGSWIGGNTTSSYLSYYLPSSWGILPNLNGTQTGYVDPYGFHILQLDGLSSGTHSIRVRTRNLFYSGSTPTPPATRPSPAPGSNCCVGSWSEIKTYSVTY